jgi:hypothetical protein
MHTGRKRQKIDARRMLNALLAMVLLVLYVAGNTGSGIVHQLFHTGPSLVLHTPAQERDVCHRAIYHFGKDPKHNVHLTVSDKRDRCHLLVHADQLALDIPRQTAMSPAIAFVENLTVGGAAQIYLVLSSRAPPLI